MKKKINIIIQKIKEYKAFMYVLISICFSGLVDLFFTEMMIFDNYYLSFIISFLIVLLVAFIIDFVIYMYKLPRKTTLDDARDKINQAGSKFIIPGKEAKDKDPTNQMFYLAENEYDLVKKHSTEATDKNKPNEMRNIVYYSLSVKKYLNWIDYSYFKFLADLKKELKCDVIICVHYNDEMRETMSSSHINQKYYKELRAWYISIIKKIIGEDTLIAYEDHIFKVKHKKYVNEFHYYFNQQVINETSNMLDNKKPEDIENENYSNFKRKLSNLESVFPIAMIAEKYTKNKRLFVLDNIKNLENWQDPNSDLFEIKNKKYPFIILSAQMLTDKDGRKINVHDESKVPNFTDEKIRFIDKIKNIEDNSVKELMISFLNGGKINCKPNYYDKKLEKLYDNVVRLYKIVPFIDKTKNGNSEG